MDAIDNLIYSTLNVCGYPSLFESKPITSVFESLGISEPSSSFPLPTSGQTTIPGGTYPSNFNASTGIISYQQETRKNFAALDDSNVIADAVQKHWYDIANRISYTNTVGMIDATGTSLPMYHPLNTPPNPLSAQAFVKFNIPPYHLIYSYLVENTRIAQIFERMISMYVHDEKLTKASDRFAFKWIFNTETLFYSNSRSGNRRGMTSQLRPVSEAIRRNAYQRMFGMDLAFGDQNNGTYNYTKADFANSSFITLFESFLVEFWRGFTNANNTSGQNTTDTEHLEDLSRRLQELMMGRRTTELDFTNYRNFNLSAEEYSSYIFMYWLFFAISFDSPVVSYLNCNANTPGERLINIGRKVGLPAHTKSIAILDIAQPMNLTLRSIELGLFNDSNFLQRVMRSLSTINPIPNPTPQEISILNNMLLIINNWEKATGHRIKNPEASITGTVKVQQNGTPQNGVAVKPKVIMN